MLDLSGQHKMLDTKLSHQSIYRLKKNLKKIPIIFKKIKIEYLITIFSKFYIYLTTLRGVSSLDDPQNSEMKICEKYEVDMLKIIIGYILWTISLLISHNIIVNDEK